MSDFRSNLGAALALVVLTVSGCASGGEVLRPEGPRGYVVKGSTATYAGSPLPYDITRGSLEPLYFGQYVVRSLGARGGFSSDVGGDSRSKPEGAVIAIWKACEVAGVKEIGFPEF